MAAHGVVLLTTESSGQLWNVAAWNPCNAASLKTFKGGSSSASRTLDIVHDGDYIVSADSNKPVINVWSLATQNHAHSRMVCSGLVTAIAVSSDGKWCVGAIDSKLHVWQTGSGNLLAILSGHYSKVTCIRFVDGPHVSYFLSASEDGHVLVWFLQRVVSIKNPSTEPHVSFTKHTGCVTDISLCGGGCEALALTSSTDKSIRLWRITDGHLLKTYTFDHAITSVCINSIGDYMFAGTSTGDIHIIQTRPNLKRSMLRGGHSDAVTCLSLTMDGLNTILISGSKDSTVLLWNIQSRSYIEKIQHKGPVTNCKIIKTPAGLLQPVQHLVMPLPTFQRQLVTEVGASRDCFVRLKAQ